jgi:hypothetical protein
LADDSAFFDRTTEAPDFGTNDGMRGTKMLGWTEVVHGCGFRGDEEFSPAAGSNQGCRVFIDQHSQ